MARLTPCTRGCDVQEGHIGPCPRESGGAAGGAQGRAAKYGAAPTETASEPTEDADGLNAAERRINRDVAGLHDMEFPRSNEEAALAVTEALGNPKWDTSQSVTELYNAMEHKTQPKKSFTTRLTLETR